MGKKSSAKAKEKKQRRKEEIFRMANCRMLVNTANSQEDPMSSMPLFKKFERNGLNVEISCVKGTMLDGRTLDWAFMLTKKNMQSLYENSEWGWSDREKREELMDERAWFLVVRKVKSEHGTNNCQTKDTKNDKIKEGNSETKEKKNETEDISEMPSSTATSTELKKSLKVVDEISEQNVVIDDGAKVNKTSIDEINSNSCSDDNNNDDDDDDDNDDADDTKSINEEEDEISTKDSKSEDNGSDICNNNDGDDNNVHDGCNKNNNNNNNNNISSSSGCCNHGNNENGDNDDDLPLAFVHFRFDMDNDIEVLYCYEIQLMKQVRHRGLGKFLIQILELLAFKAQMKKVLLTTFKHNMPAVSFFKKLKYNLDETNPGHHEDLCCMEDNEDEEEEDDDCCSYVILSKNIGLPRPFQSHPSAAPTTPRPHHHHHYHHHHQQLQQQQLQHRIAMASLSDSCQCGHDHH